MSREERVEEAPRLSTILHTPGIVYTRDKYISYLYIQIRSSNGKPFITKFICLTKIGRLTYVQLWISSLTRKQWKFLEPTEQRDSPGWAGCTLPLCSHWNPVPCPKSFISLFQIPILSSGTELNNRDTCSFLTSFFPDPQWMAPRKVKRGPGCFGLLRLPVCLKTNSIRIEFKGCGIF